ncbi:MAG: hypothetical protein ABI552_19095, partial [Casimicrobiaceae bacterium]
MKIGWDTQCLHSSPVVVRAADPDRPLSNSHDPFNREHSLTKLQVSLGCCDYDRTRAIFDGRVPIENCEVLAAAIEPEEAFHRAFRFQEFDISELSLSSHTMLTSRGANEYVGVPAFVSRLFRHSSVY